MNAETQTDLLSSIDPAELNNASRLRLVEKLLHAALPGASAATKAAAALVIGKIRLHGDVDARIDLIDAAALPAYDTINFEEIVAQLAGFEAESATA